MYRGEYARWSLSRIFASALVRKVAYVLVGLAATLIIKSCHAATCVGVDVNGFVVADATPVDTCPGYVLATRQEFADAQSIWVPLTVADGVAIGMAIFTAFAVAFGFRMLRRVIEDAGEVDGG